MRKKIDQAIRGYGMFLLRFRWWALGALLLLTIFMVSNLRHITMDASNESFFQKDDPVLLQYNEFREQFGRDDMILLMLEPKDLFSKEFFEVLGALHEELVGADPLIKDVNSLNNARKTTGAEGSLVVQDLMENFSGTPEEIAAIKEYVLQHPLYKNLLISEDGRYTNVVIEISAYSLEGEAQATGFDTNLDNTPTKAREPLSDMETSRIVNVVEEIARRHAGDTYQVRIAGSPTVTSYLKTSMMKDMRKLSLMAVGMIAVFLALMFRRASGVVLPLLTVLLSLLYTIGLMGLVGVPITMPTQILPSFLIAVAVGASVHLMALFYKDFILEHGNKEPAILDAMEHSGLPIIMTSLTTAAGLFSFATAEVAPIGDLGVFAGFGVMVSLFLTLTMIPLLLAVVPVKSIKSADPEAQPHFVENLLVKIGDYAFDHAGKIVIISGVLFVLAVVGMTRLQFVHNTLEWFPKTSEIYQNTKLIDEKMKGSISIEMVVKTNQENGLYDPAIQNGLQHMSDFALEPNHNGGVSVGKVVGLHTMLKEINQALNTNDPKYYVIPQDREMIAQEFLLFENTGSDDLSKNVDSLFSMARVTYKTNWQNANDYEEMLTSLRAEAKQTFGDKVTVYFTGMTALFSETIYLMINTMVTSYLAAFAVITLLMILLIGKVKLGLISMIPNLLPIILTLGLMGWLGINLDMFTLLIGSIVIGLAVDDTIHFFHNYRKYLEEYGDVKMAIEKTLDTAGRAMLITSVVLTFGFWLFMLATMNNLFNFGLLVGFAIVLAFLADVFLSPALLTLMDRRNKNG